MEEIYLKLRIELDPNTDPKPTMDEIVTLVKELLTVGEEGIGKETPFGIRDVTPL